MGSLFSDNLLPMTNDSGNYKKVCDNVDQHNRSTNAGNAVCFLIGVACFFTQGFGPESPNFTE
jgi:hypothetical protein